MKMSSIVGHLRNDSKFPLIPTRMAVIKKTSNKCCPGSRQRGILILYTADGHVKKLNRYGKQHGHPWKN